MTKAIPFLVLVFALAMTAGCSSDTDDLGVVARVNGKPIYLSQLEYRHDLMHMDASGAYVPTVETLREEYGRLLTDFIVMELVFQELAARDLSVTDEELAAEEAKIRADYPEDAFEQVLIEEYIDIAAWREQLKYRIAKQKFFQQVLRPRVKVDYKEAEQYYKDHIEDFRVPESVHVLVIRGQRLEDVQKAVNLYRQDSGLEPIKAMADDTVAVREMTVPRDNLSDTWKDTLKGMPEKEASPITEARDAFEALILLENIPARTLDPSQAYPMVEERLLEDKLQKAFADWIEAQLKTADIQVTSHLLPLDQPAPEIPEEAETPTGIGAAPEKEEYLDPIFQDGENGAPLGEEDGLPLEADPGADGAPLGDGAGAGK